MGCFFRPKSNSLWSLWYGFFATGLFVYLILIGFKRYEVLTKGDMPKTPTPKGSDHPVFATGGQAGYDNDNAFRHGIQPGHETRTDPRFITKRQALLQGDRIKTGQMNGGMYLPQPYERYSDVPTYPRYLLLIYVILHIVATVFMLFFICATCLKVGNLANDNERLGDFFDDPVIETNGDPCCGSIRSLWRHSPPTAVSFHLMITMCILMANALISVEYFAMFRRGADGQTVPVNELEAWNMGPLDFLFANRLRLAAPGGPGSFRQVEVVSALNVPPRLVPILADYHVYGMPLDFLLHVFGLLLFMMVYPSIFWKTGPCFGMLFSIMLLVHAVDAVCGWLGFTLMLRLHKHGYIQEKMDDVNLRLHQILSPSLLIANYLLTSALSYLSATVLHCYGYGRYIQALQSQRRDTKIGITPRCDGYLPNACAIVVLVLLVLCRAPLFYDMLMLSQIQNSTPEQVKLLLCISASVLFLFTWLIVWLILTLKRDWGFIVPPLAFHLYRKSDPGTLIVLYGKDTFLVDDHHKRAGILTLLDKNRANDPDVYWLRPQTRVVGQTPPPGRPSLPHTPLDERKELSYRAGSRQGSLIGHEPSEPPGWEAETDQISPTRSNRRPPLGPRGSGSYIRFNDESYEPLNDPVTTFGTMPRGTDPRTIEMQRRRRQHEMQQRGATTTMGPNYSNVTYALVQKRQNALANQGPAAGYYKLPQNNGEYPSETVALLEEQQLSRASSYSNVPSTHGRAQFAGAQALPGPYDVQMSARGGSMGPQVQDGRYASYASIQNQQASLRQRASHSPEQQSTPRSPVSRGPLNGNPQGRPPMVPNHNHSRMTSFSSNSENPYQSRETTPQVPLPAQQPQDATSPSGNYATYAYPGGYAVYTQAGVPTQAAYGQHPIVVHKQNGANLMEDSGIVASGLPSQNGSESSGSAGRSKGGQPAVPDPQNPETFVTSVV